MNNEEQILDTLKRLLEVQEQVLATQKQAFEMQQRAIASQQTAIRNQLATGRIYRVSLCVFAVGLAVLFYYISHLGR